MPTKDAWELYYACFSNGQNVVIVSDYDAFEWGALRTVGTGCWLARHGRTDKFFRWDYIRFMAHDGFPVKRLMGADGSKLIEGLGTADSTKAIRKALVTKPRQAHMQATFGDPCRIEDVHAELFNAGNAGPGFWNGSNEEVVSLRAPDGAKGLLWNLETVFFAEIAGQFIRAT